jgi:hypothetical protein
MTIEGIPMQSPKHRFLRPTLLSVSWRIRPARVEVLASASHSRKDGEFQVSHYLNRRHAPQDNSRFKCSRLRSAKLSAPKVAEVGFTGDPRRGNLRGIPLPERANVGARSATNFFANSSGRCFFVHRIALTV